MGGRPTGCERHVSMNGPSTPPRRRRLRPNPNPFSPPPPSSPPQRISLYHPSLRPLLSCRSLRGLLQAHAHFLVTGLLHDPFAASRLLKAAADSAAAPLSYTLLLFRSVPAPDAFCANVVLKALSLSLDPLLALPFFVANLRSGFAPNSFTFPVLFSACARASSLDSGETCHGQAVKRGVDAVLHVRNSLVHMYATCGLVGCARMLFDEMSHRDTVSWNSMIDGYVTSGELNSARELFDEMPGRNVVSWNVMIGGYVKVRNPRMGLELFRLMYKKKGLKGNDKTMVSVVTACGRLGMLNGGRSIHAYYTRNFVDDNVIFGTALVDMYSRCGRVNVARRVFEEMPKRNLVCWNALIVGHCIHGDPLDGLALFDKMVGEGCDMDEETKDRFHLETTGISPDEVTFIGLLCACAREGLLIQGKKYFEQMTKLYNLKPTFAHYWCMANLYGGLGLVEEAEEVLRGMPEDEESLALGGLLGLCRFRGELELGESIAKRLVELEPSNGSRYSLLQNIYVAARKWEDAHKVKEMMRNREIRSMPGHRLVDLNEIVHNFKIGDRSKPEIEKVYEMLDDVAARLRIRGATMDLTESVQQ